MLVPKCHACVNSITRVQQSAQVDLGVLASEVASTLPPLPQPTAGGIGTFPGSIPSDVGDVAPAPAASILSDVASALETIPRDAEAALGPAILGFPAGIAGAGAPLLNEARSVASRVLSLAAAPAAPMMGSAMAPAAAYTASLAPASAPGPGIAALIASELADPMGVLLSAAGAPDLDAAANPAAGALQRAVQGLASGGLLLPGAGAGVDPGAALPGLTGTAAEGPPAGELLTDVGALLPSGSASSALSALEQALQGLAGTLPADLSSLTVFPYGTLSCRKLERRFTGDPDSVWRRLSWAALAPQRRAADCRGCSHS